MLTFTKKSRRIKTLACVFGMLILGGLFGATQAVAMTYDLKTGRNGVSLAYGDSGLATAEQLANDIPNCTAVAYWDSGLQAFVEHPAGTAVNDFPLTAGHPYFVTVNAPGQWTVPGGALPGYINFTLVTTATTNVNAVAVPLGHLPAIANADELIDAIPNCDTVWMWDADKQGFVGHAIGSTFNNFAVQEGHPYLVNVTAPGYWPDPDEHNPPLVNVVQPADGTLVADNMTTVIVQYADSESGVVTGTFAGTIDGVDRTADFEVTADTAYYTPTTAWTNGAHSVTANIFDRKGNMGTGTSNFQVGGGLQALPTATPTSGVAPLTVHFTTDGVDPQGTIGRYYWDMNGDGTWDYNDTFDHQPGETVATDHDWTYNQSGTYNALLRVLSSTGQTADATITIQVGNTPPTATATVTPTNGPIPLDVVLQGFGNDPDGQIVLYEWDYEGDGTWDYSSATTGNTNHTYTVAGTYNAVFRVTDNEGATATALATTTTLRPGPPGSPTAVLAANPTQGNAPLNVNFNGAQSMDSQGLVNQNITFDWDWNSDGTYEVIDGPANPSHQYADAGLQVCTMRVNDTNTGLSSISQAVITVNINATLGIQTNTVGYLNGPAQPLVGTNVNTNITAGTTVSIYIKDKTGAVVRRLVTSEARALGNYQDYWDCTDDNGVAVPDGPYYAVLQYLVDGNQVTLDQTYTTGGVRSSLPSGYGDNTRDVVQGTFTPFADQLLPINFRINPTQEITLFIGPLYGGGNEDRTRTILNRKTLPKGAHTAYWDGLDDQGNVAHPTPVQYSLILGMWRYSLPTNALYMTGGRPVVSNMTTTPNYWSPVNKTCLDHGDSIDVKYDLSEDASVVTLTVQESNSHQTVRTVQVAMVTAGTDRHIYWDAKDDNGNYVEPGDYQLFLTATDSEGNTSLMAAENLVRMFY